MRCIVDCREDKRLDNNYLELSLWGKPCFAYVIEAVEKSRCFSNLVVMTNSISIHDYCKKHFPGTNICMNTLRNATDEVVFNISGRAPCISSATINIAANTFSGVRMISARKEASYDYMDNDAAISFYNGEKQHRFNAFVIGGGGDCPKTNDAMTR